MNGESLIGGEWAIFDCYIDELRAVNSDDRLKLTFSFTRGLRLFL